MDATIYIRPDEAEFSHYLNDIEKQLSEAINGALQYKNVNGIDPRWMNIARTHFQEGFTAARRAVTQSNSPWGD